MVGEYTSVGIVRASRDLLKAHVQLIPCNTLKEHTAGGGLGGHRVKKNSQFFFFSYSVE